MPRSSDVLLQTQEWDKLKKTITKKEEPIPKDDKHFKIKDLVEKSQAMVKTWPDSKEASAKGLEEQRENRRKENKTLIKDFSHKPLPKNNTSKEIKKARQLIFDNSCYGNQLLSSALASVVEERTAQVQFNNELKQKLIKTAKEQSKLNKLPAFNVHEAIIEKQNRLTTLKIAKQNKKMYEETEKRNLDRKLKEENVNRNKIDTELIKIITDQETEYKLKTKRMQKQAIEEFKAQQKQYKKSKETRNTLYDVLTETYRKGQDRLKCKIAKVNKKIVTDKQNDTSKCKQVFKTIEKLHNQEEQAYHDFLEKGVKANEERQKADEQKITGNKRKHVKIEESVKTGPGMVKEKPKFSERSSNTLKSTIAKQKGLRKLQTEYEFKDPQVTLLDGLNKREKEKDATKAAHAQFAEQVATALQDCKPKHFVKKVIDDYRRVNNLNTKTLPIPDY